MAIQDEPSANPAATMPIGKLRGVGYDLRLRLKRLRVTKAMQLLEAAGPREAREALAERLAVDPSTLEALVRRADMARINGIGAVFGDMLAMLGTDVVQRLAVADPSELHARLVELNRRERLARRSPTPEEVADWVAQAQRLPPMIEPTADGV